MFQRLQKKWKVSGLRVILILCTFAIGGSLTGYAGKKLVNLFSIDRGGLWLLVYILVITLLWPLAVLTVSFPFGQYRFFTSYLKRMGRRMGLVKKMTDNEQWVIDNRQLAISNEQKTKGNEQQETGNPLTTHHSPLTTHIAIFASGAGSNAQKIIDHFRNSSLIKISLIVCNKPGAGVLDITKKENIPSLLIEKERFFRGDAYINELKANEIDFIVLAGFLWKIPSALIKAYPGKIVNIHPALLPNYGGKGMYGNFVHEAVIAAGEKESGITIHYVDDHYDNGDIIFQARCAVQENDTAASLAQRIHLLEHEHYPKVIEKIVSKEVKK